MKKVIRLTESDLVGLVKRVIVSEQTKQKIVNEMLSFLQNTLKFKLVKKGRSSTEGAVFEALPPQNMAHNVKKYVVTLYPQQAAFFGGTTGHIIGIKFDKIVNNPIKSPKPKEPYSFVKRISDFSTIQDFKNFVMTKFWDQ